MEGENIIKMGSTPLEKYPSLQKRYDTLESQRQKHFKLYKEILSADNSNVYLQDNFVIGVLKRSLDLLDGIISLVNQWNFSAASALLRMQVDSLLRLYYSTQRSDKEFYIEFYKGKSFNQIKHNDGKSKLTDKFLRDIARPLYPWVDNVYEKSSRSVHLSSEYHFYTTILSVNESERSMETFFGTGNTNWPEKTI